MIRESDILALLVQEPSVSLEQLTAHLKISERMVREHIKSIRNDAIKNGFDVITIRNKGYSLQITDEGKYTAFARQLDAGMAENAGDKTHRIPLILYFLLQQTDYIPLQTISELIDVSRATLVNDLPELREYLRGYHLTLQSKSHYGIKLEGDERDFRKAFNRFVLASPEYTAMVTFPFTSPKTALAWRKLWRTAPSTMTSALTFYGSRWWR